MIKPTILIAIILLSSVPIYFENGFALQEVAGKIHAQLKSGQNQTFQWGLLSDSNSQITVALSSSGNGSQFLSFPSSANLEPHKLLYVNVTVSIPSSYTTTSELTPTLIAKQFGQQGGATVINIELTKQVIIDINEAQSQQATGSSVPEFPTGIAVLLISTIAIILITFRSSHR